MLEKNDKVRDYTLLKFLGKGQFGEVWLAEKKLEFANRSLYNVNGVGRICPLNLSFLGLSPLLAVPAASSRQSPFRGTRRVRGESYWLLCSRRGSRRFPRPALPLGCPRSGGSPAMSALFKERFHRTRIAFATALEPGRGLADREAVRRAHARHRGDPRRSEEHADHCDVETHPRAPLERKTDHHIS